MNAIRPWSSSPSAVGARGKVQSGRGKAKAQTVGEMSVLSLSLAQWPSAWAKAHLQHPCCCLCCSQALMFLCFQLLLTNEGRECSRLAPGFSSLPAPALSWCNLSLTCRLYGGLSPALIPTLKSHLYTSKTTFVIFLSPLLQNTDLPFFLPPIAQVKHLGAILDSPSLTSFPVQLISMCGQCPHPHSSAMGVCLSSPCSGTCL